MDKERLPRWGWLMVGLFLAVLVANLLNLLVLVPAVFPEAYRSVTVITTMSPVLIYVGIWYDEDRRRYWTNSRAKIAGDVLFVVTGRHWGRRSRSWRSSVPGSPTFCRISSRWASASSRRGLFWWRNQGLYADEPDR